jgi:hypothetical protein
MKIKYNTAVFTPGLAEFFSMLVVVALAILIGVMIGAGL